MQAPVVVAGVTTLDLCFAVQSFPHVGTKQPANAFAALGGGQGANVAANLAILGRRVSFLSEFGDDLFAKLSCADLNALGVDTRLSSVAANCSQTTAVVLTDASSGERTIVSYRPPALAYPLDSLVPEEALKGAAALYTDAVRFDLSVALARTAASLGITVVSDLEHVPTNVDDLLDHVNYLIAPYAVLAEVAGDESIVRVGSLAHANRVVIATRGSDGSLLFRHGREPQLIPSSPCNVVDTTGAGDAYHAGFIHALLSGHDVLAACSYATRVASLACTVFGPRLKPGMSLPLTTLGG
jgi:sulfofructose kinase